MTHAVRARALGFLQGEERQLSRPGEVALAMLMMDSERLGRKPPQLAERPDAADASRLGQLDDLTPDGRRLGESPLAPVPDAKTVERFTPHFRSP